jgi:branched-chain amino acid transport system substrate-binding protein
MGFLWATALLISPFASVQGGAEEKVVKIGVLTPLSGPLASMGKYELMGYELAVEDVNSSGGIRSMGGAKLRLVVADTESKVEVGMAQVERLAGSDVAAIMGAFQSGVTIATTQVAEMKRIPYVVPLSVADEITERGFKYTFRACSSSKMAVARQAEFVYGHLGELRPEIPMRRVALLYENSAFGEAIAGHQKEMVRRYGKELVADMGYSAKASDVSVEVARLKALAPDVLLRTGYAPDDLLVTRTMISMRFSPTFWLGFSGVADLSYVHGLDGKYVEYTVFMDPFSPKVPGAPEVLERFRKKYGVDMTAMPRSVYPVVWAVKDALERAGSADREKLRDALTKTKIMPGEKGNIMPYPMMFDEKGQNSEARYNALQYQGGSYRVVWPREWAEAQLVWPWPRWEDR